MSTPFAGVGEFKAPSGEKNARESLIEYAEQHGWLLDLTATRSRHTWRATDLEQDPNQFVRAADHGGQWVLALDYEVKGDPDSYKPHRSWDNTLRGCRIWHSSDVDAKGVVQHSWDLRNYVQSNTARCLMWDLTNREDGKFKPLRKRAEELIRFPDLMIWLLEEKRHSVEERNRRRQEEWARQARERRRPLPILTSNNEFRSLCNTVRRTMSEMVDADGTTNLYELIRQAERQLAAVKTQLVIREEDCFYCATPLSEQDRKIDPNNQRTYGPCCHDHVFRFERKRGA